MRDPLLLTYAVAHEPVDRGPLLYDISSGLQPMSIRDQMLRGYTLVKRALAKKLIEPNQELPILIIGGGVAGALAALTAVKNNVPAALVEKSGRLFVKQIRAQHRIVCPTLYDWPASHWKRGVFPWKGKPMPLSWRRLRASEMVTDWQSELTKAADQHPNLLSLRLRTTYLSHRIDPVAQAVYADFDRPFTARPFSIAIACGGAGSERTSVPKDHPTYRGYPFWSSDPYEKSNLGLSDKVKPNVLISGGGDGSLQDYLRILCRKTAGELYENLPDDVKPFIETMVGKIEDASMRSYLWGESGEIDHPIHLEVHAEYYDLVIRLLTEHKYSGPVKRSLKRLLDGVVNKLDIKFIYPCEHFWSCYPLNRFLVLLMSEYIQRELNVKTLEPNTKLLNVSGVDHSCVNRPALCHGKQHEITIADATCLDYNSDRNRRVLPDGPFNVVIVRHGIEPSEFPFKTRPSANPYRQLMPYSSPW